MKVSAPSLLGYHPNVHSLIQALGAEVSDRERQDARNLVERGLPPAISIDVICCIFGYSPSFLRAVLGNPFKYYRSFGIKHGRKVRKIYAPKMCLKVIQRWIGYHSSRSVQFCDSVHGFVPGKSPLSAASKHLGASWVYCLDIVQFFPSTPCALIEKNLEDLGYPAYSLRLLSSILTLQGQLTQGSPASPFLSNLVFREWDDKVQKICDGSSITYTRYADDMVFSSPNNMPSGFRDEIKGLFEGSPWHLSAEKESLEIKRDRMKVHGLLVGSDSLKLSKGYRNKIRAYRHVSLSGISNPDEMKRINGHLAYAKAIEQYNEDLHII